MHRTRPGAPQSQGWQTAGSVPFWLRRMSHLPAWPNPEVRARGGSSNSTDRTMTRQSGNVALPRHSTRPQLLRAACYVVGPSCKRGSCPALGVATNLGGAAQQPEQRALGARTKRRHKHAPLKGCWAGAGMPGAGAGLSWLSSSWRAAVGPSGRAGARRGRGCCAWARWASERERAARRGRGAGAAGVATDPVGQAGGQGRWAPERGRGRRARGRASNRAAGRAPPRGGGRRGAAGAAGAGAGGGAAGAMAAGAAGRRWRRRGSEEAEGRGGGRVLRRGWVCVCPPGPPPRWPPYGGKPQFWRPGLQPPTRRPRRHGRAELPSCPPNRPVAPARTLAALAHEQGHAEALGW